MNKLFFTIAFSFVISLTFSQQEAKFTVEVSSDSVVFGNYFEVKFVLENAQGSQFVPPSFEGFTVVGGPNQSSSFSMVNGRVSQNMSYSYYLKPEDIGFYFIKPANVKVGNEVLETLPKKILVMDKPGENKSSPQPKTKEKQPAPLKETSPGAKQSQKKRKIYQL